MVPSGTPAWFSQAYLACTLHPTYFFEHQQRPGWRTRRSRRASYSLYVVTAGSLRCLVQGKVLVAGPGDSLLLPPGVLWMEDGGLDLGSTRLLIADILVHPGPGLDPLLRLPLPLVCRPDPAAVHFAQTVADRLRPLGRGEIVRRCREGRLLDLRATIVVLMDAVITALFADPALVVAPATWPPAVHAAWACIERSPLDARLDLAAIAKAAQVSSSRLSALCQQYFQDSPWNLVIKRRLAHARMVLRNEPHLPLAQIALRCGWSDVRWFRRLYRRHFGGNPKRGPRQDSARPGESDRRPLLPRPQSSR